MFDTHITTSADHAGQLHRDREHAHTAILSLWHHRASSARAAVGALWTVTHADMLTNTGHVLVRSTVPPERTPHWAHTLTTTDRSDYTPTTGEPLQLTLELETGRSPHIPVPRELEHALKQGANGTPRQPGHGLAFRSRRETVPYDELPTWATAKLARHGINTHTVSVLRTGTIHLPRHHNTIHPIATLTISGTITDPETYHHALHKGLGKGKAFGLGLLRDTNHTEATQKAPQN